VSEQLYMIIQIHEGNLKFIHGMMYTELYTLAVFCCICY